MPLSQVLACRARKDQKAKLVQLIREGVPGKVTLAIGDGANDVEMVTENTTITQMLQSMILKIPGVCHPGMNTCTADFQRACWHRHLRQRGHAGAAHSSTNAIY